MLGGRECRVEDESKNRDGMDIGNNRADAIDYRQHRDIGILHLVYMGKQREGCGHHYNPNKQASDNARQRHKTTTD